uniref:WLM domain-containing protein n=1 Tax=Rhodosorus marinus TaxID=101924 RepID=A0A7S3E8Z9_9RHOD|mmetsp:Transcript_18490/g.74301  ORF Transcript_18490/g.74301 Transcript_18490/m.74301 type:complete len:198 (+) Transcript_18490:118-711(+)
MVINTLDSEIFCVCEEVVTLGLPGDKNAKEILNRAAEMVKPIMAEKKWKVRVLAEFYPPQSNLLGLNHDHGRKIEIRLRNPRDENQFLSEESVLQTLLHELCHNEIGPHNEQFYKLLDEITAKAENLIISKGFSTTSGGKKLSNERRNPDVVDKRRLSAAAAERRLQRQQLFSKPVRLGGGQDQLHRVRTITILHST